MKAYWRFLQKDWQLLAFGFCCVFWGNLGQSFFVGQYSQFLKTEFDLSASAYGELYALATLGSALTLMWVGPLIDRWSLRKFFLFVASGLLLATFLMSQVSSLIALVLALYLLRLFGQGLSPHIGSTTMSRHFHADRGKALSVSGCGVPVGEIVLPLAAVALSAWLGWRNSWLVGVVSIPLLLVPLGLLLLKNSAWRDEHLEQSEDVLLAKADSAWRLLLRDIRFWLVLPVMLVVPFFATAVFIHQDIILEQKNWSPALMAAGFVAYGVVHWASAMVSGVLVDKYSALSMLRIYNLPLILCLLIVANCSGAWVLMAMLIFLGTTIGSGGPIFGSLWVEAYGTKRIGGIRSITSSLAVLSTSLSPYLFGVLFDEGFSVGMIFNVMALALVALNALLLFSYTRKNISPTHI